VILRRHGDSKARGHGKGASTLFFESTTGRKISFGRMHDTASDADMNNPTAARDFGNGFLMKRGYVLAWVGWGADIAPATTA